jgi:triphosphoribosyl-dephospho-CoA synthase
MTSPLTALQRRCLGSSDAIRWACVLEATAPKAGNVFPGRRFEDLSFVDFVHAAEITAAAFDRHAERFSQAVWVAADKIAEEIHTNVNLGILLLLGPLVQSELQLARNRRSSQPLSPAQWRATIVELLSKIDAEDTNRLYAAINRLAPGGMGKADKMDLASPAPTDFLAAMISAADRDRIATNYRDGFQDLFENVVPCVHRNVTADRDLLAGIAKAHLELLAEQPDTLIRRKFGETVAADVQQRAADTLKAASPEAETEFDHFLRSGATSIAGSHRTINPGTTADLIAAALYVLLRNPVRDPE